MDLLRATAAVDESVDGRGRQRAPPRNDDWTFAVELDLTPRQRDTLLAGGKFAEIKRGE